MQDYRIVVIHLPVSMKCAFAHFSWHQVINVGSVRVLYATINHEVVKLKRNLYSVLVAGERRKLS